MSLCWLAPAQRPSLRELRIMLLHLRSSRDELEASEFDQRWNQLMPRSAAAIATTLPSVIADANDDEEAEMNFTFAPSTALPKSAQADVPVMLPAVHSLATPGVLPAIRPGSFDSEFGSEFNASLLAHAGSRQTSLRSLSTSPGNTPDDVPLDDSFATMAPSFAISSEHTLAANVKATTTSPSAFEMVSYGKTGEVEVTESENEMQAHVDVSVSDNVPEVPLSSTSTTTLPAETGQAVYRENAKDGFIPGEENWQNFSESSVNQSLNSSSAPATDQKLISVSKTDRVKLSLNVSDGLVESEDNFSAVENGHGAEDDVSSREQQDSGDGSFCMLKVSIGEDDSLTKSLDIESPAKSTTSSADWCLVSNHTEHSRDEELDSVSHVTDPSLPGDCVLVEKKETVASEELSEDVLNTDTDTGSADMQQSAVGTEQLTDNTADH